MSEQRIMTLECAGCTAPLSEAIVATGVHKCPYCGYVNILPKEEQSSEVLHHLRNADTELKNGEFERAYNEYFEASKLDSEESKAYFGMALAANRVKHIKDVVNNRWQAICCEVTEKKFGEDTNYHKALEYATEEQRAEYTQRANEIDYIREKFVELQSSGLSYDTFICVKVSDGQGGFTPDSHWAGKIYDNLKKSGLKPFYSEREIGDRTGEDYEALILYALYTSKSMLIVCSNEDYLRTPWVQNEYTRYYSMMSENDKLKNSIMIVFSDKVVERIPGIPGKIQGVALGSFGDAQLITEFVSRFANAEERARKKAEEEAQRMAEQKAKEEAQQKMLEELQRQLQEARNSAKINEEAEAEQKAREKAEAERRAYEEDRKNFMMTNGCLTRYIGTFTDVVIPDSVTKIGNEAFRDCTSLTSIVIPDSVISIEGEAFKCCTSLKTVIIPNNVTSIGALAFKNCTSLRSVTIGNSVTTIGKEAFRDCPSLTSIVLPNSVISIGEGAFYNCPSLTSVNYLGTIEEWCDISFDNVSANPLRAKLFLNGELVTDLVIPSSVTEIKNHTFSYFKSLTSIVIPNGVTSIGNEAFYYCTSLTSVTIPNSVTSIGNEAFRGCTSLTSIEIPNSVTSIRTWAFHGCEKLIINCYVKKPLFGLPKGFHKEWAGNSSTRVNWIK